MTASEGADDAMQAAAQRQCTSSLAPVCKWFVRSGTCRSKSCPFPHVKVTDNFQTHASYDERVWSLSSTEDDEPAAGQTWRFSIASYNILADKYARHYRSYLYHEVPATYLDWHHRRSTILAELAYLLPDIICLQEVDRFEDLEEELEQLGYSGIYLQRDGGRRDGCATFWRHDLLRPAVVRSVRFSQFDLKDNVALLVLFEPLTGRQTATNPVAAAAGATRQQQEQTNSQAWDRQQHSQQANSFQQQQQQLYGQSPRQDPLSQWLPKGWLWSNSSNSSSSSHTRSSQVLLRPVHPHGQISTHQGSPGSLYQIPTLLQEHQQQQQQQQQQGFHSSLDTAAANGSQSGSSAGRRGHRRSGSGGSSRRQSLEQQLRERRAEAAQEQQQQPAPDWARCGLLVANTHIIFTPDKGEVKLGQARLLVQEAAQLAEWYLSQQQQQNSTPNGSSDPPAQSLDAGMQAVAAILTGDFNATPHSPLYTYMSKGLLDLQTVNKRNVSHMASSSSSSSHHHKGYRGFRRTNRRRSAEYQQQQQQQQQQQEAASLAAGYQPQAQQQQQQQQDILSAPKEQQQQQQARVAVTADARGGLQSQHTSVIAAAVSAGEAVGSTGSPSSPAAAGSGASQQQLYAEQQSSGNSGWRSSPGAAASGVSEGTAGSSNSSTTQQQVPVNPTGHLSRSGSAGTPHGPVARSSSSGGGGILSALFRQGSSSTAADAGSTQQQIAGSPQPSSSSILPGQKHYRWSDKEVRRASGLSYDELVDASLSFLSESDADSPDGYTSPDAQIGRAAAAFAAQAAAGAGAAAAAAAAATAAEDPAAGVLGRSPGGGLFRAAVARAASASEPLLLQHGLKLSSSYRSVLGQEPDYTSSHSQFMDCCDYIWYTSTAWTPQSSSTMQDQQQAAASSSSSSSSSNDGCGCYELRPVAVLQPPDGMKLNKGLPSKNLGSDHICLLTDFELVLKQ